MKRRLAPLSLAFIICGVVGSVSAQGVSWDRIWTSEGEELARRAPEEMWITPAAYHGFTLDAESFLETIRMAPMEFTDAHREAPVMLTIPRPDGTFETFEVAESPVMELELAQKFPEIRTYIGQSIDNPGTNARLDWTPQGFHASVRSPDGSYFVDPHYRNDVTTYVSYFRRDFHKPADFLCGFEELFGEEESSPVGHLRDIGEFRTGETLRTYRVAVATTGEYTAFHGGTVNSGLAAVVTAMNRVNQVYENDLSIRMVLVANNNLIIYTNSATDPYTNNSGSTMLGQNQTNLDSVIGSANYDIGHVFSTGGGGVAGLGVVCIGGSKARGVTGQGSPTGDPFWIDYVAHEMGHQWGGSHTFNGNVGSCSGNRSASSAYEPGSGSTIQAYAGICGSDNLQSNSDPYFHVRSLNQMGTFSQSGSGNSCSAQTSTGNTPPSANAGANYTIPARTPFELTGSGMDVDGDTLTFCWEQFDLGAAQGASGQVDNGASPLFRSFNPTLSPVRTFPRLPDLLTNTVRIGEVLPSTSRTMNFRLTVRDNRAGAGGTAIDSNQVTTVSTAGPFRVTAPNTNVLWSGVREVTWDVAGTDLAPINSANVNIRLSTDGGLTFPTMLAENIPNTGDALVLFPNITTSTARLRIEGSGNIYFDVSDTNFRIEPGTGVSFLSGGLATIDDSTGNGNNNGLPDPGESTIAVTIPLRNAGPDDATNVTATLTSSSGLVSFVQPDSFYGNMPADAVDSNATPFVIALDPAFPCGQPVPLTLNVTSDEGGGTVNYSIATGYPDPNATETRGLSPNLGFGGAGQGSGFTLPLSFSSAGEVSSITATVNVPHQAVGELTITLVSSDGTRVRLFNNNGDAGQNLTGTIFDDNAAMGIAKGSAPFTGSFRPDQPLSAFFGKPVSGTWFMEIMDNNTAANGGTVQSVSVTIGYGGLQCDPIVFKNSKQTWEIR